MEKARLPRADHEVTIDYANEPEAEGWFARWVTAEGNPPLPKAHSTPPTSTLDETRQNVRSRIPEGSIAYEYTQEAREQYEAQRRHGGPEEPVPAPLPEEPVPVPLPSFPARPTEQDIEEMRKLLAEQKEELRRLGLEELVRLDEGEQQVMDDLNGILARIKFDWDLIANDAELVQAVHTIQSFVIQHMLQRLNPKSWGTWYRPDAEGRPAERTD